MKKRLLTSLFLATLYLGLIIPALLVHPIFYDVLVLIFMFSAAYEMMNVISAKLAPPMKVCVYLNVIVNYVVFRLANFWGQGSWGISACFVSLLGMFVICFVYCMFTTKFGIENIMSTMFILIYPLCLLTYLLALNYMGDAYRGIGIVSAFGITSLVDSMALFVGSAFKGKKLLPSVSPNKTVAGAIGGIFGGILGGLIVYLLCYFNFVNLSLFASNSFENVLFFVILGLGVSIACQAGDLIASFIKRFCAVKDYSNILPGHGGFMDRIDGVMVSAIFIFAMFAIYKLLI